MCERARARARRRGVVKGCCWVDVVFCFFQFYRIGIVVVSLFIVIVGLIG